MEKPQYNDHHRFTFAMHTWEFVMTAKTINRAISENGPAATAPTVEPPPVHHPLREERMAAGKAHRQVVPRSSLGEYTPAADRPDPIAMLAKTNEGRMAQLIPLRHGRMMPSPFTFLRGAAAAMAFDLGHSPSTELRVQLCGDCHLLNFGGYGTPERNFLFDIVDYDETSPGPFEWDVKRLAASFHVAGRSLSHAESVCAEAAEASACSYRERIAEFAQMKTMEVWYAHIDEDMLLDLAENGQQKKRIAQGIAKARERGGDKLLKKISEFADDGKPRFKDIPPTLFHPDKEDHFAGEIRGLLRKYRASLSDERRMLLDRFHVADVCMKVVGVGSVGTRCAILFMTADEDDHLILQLKEARTSVLEQFAGKSRFGHSGQRVVIGQRLMQAASDLFLGWASTESGQQFYVRQLRDMKGSVDVEGFSDAGLIGFAAMCGWALARAHAKAGAAAVISGYLGKGDVFDRAIARFAKSYADQTDQDYQAMVKAVRTGKLTAATEV
jgi:uncharacterized protein (DUF2252 family)